MEALLGLQRLGHDLVVLGPDKGRYAGLVRDAACGLIPISVDAHLRQRIARHVRGELRRHAPDILYLDGLSVPASVFVTAIGRRTRVVVRLLYLEFNRRLPMTRRLVCRTPLVAGVLADVDPAGYGDTATGRWLHDKTTLLPLPHEPDWYPAIADLTDYGIPRGAFSVGAMAESPERGRLTWLIECARRLPMDLPIHFLIVAPKESHEQLRRSIRKIPFTQRFHLAESVENAPALMAACSVFTVLDWTEELQRRALTHCMFSGVPAIAENRTPLPEIIKIGENGELLARGDMDGLAHSWFELYENPERRAALAEGATRASKQIPSLEKIIVESSETFERIVAGEEQGTHS